jgi:hypothetical protein
MEEPTDIDWDDQPTAASPQAEIVLSDSEKLQQITQCLVGTPSWFQINQERWGEALYCDIESSEQEKRPGILEPAIAIPAK